MISRISEFSFCCAEPSSLSTDSSNHTQSTFPMLLTRYISRFVSVIFRYLTRFTLSVMLVSITAPTFSDTPQPPHLHHLAALRNSTQGIRTPPPAHVVSSLPGEMTFSPLSLLPQTVSICHVAKVAYDALTYKLEDVDMPFTPPRPAFVRDVFGARRGTCDGIGLQPLLLTFFVVLLLVPTPLSRCLRSAFSHKPWSVLQTPAWMNSWVSSQGMYIVRYYSSQIHLMYCMYMCIVFGFRWCHIFQHICDPQFRTINDSIGFTLRAVGVIGVISGPFRL